MEQRASLATILAQLQALVSGDFVFALTCMAGLSALGVALDMADVKTQLPVNIASLAAQYFLMRRLLEQRGDAPGKFGSFFLVGMVTGLGILLGCIFLLLPGIYLAARWSVAQPEAIACGDGVGAAISESWRVTQPHVLPISLALVIVWLPAIGGVAISIFGGRFGLPPLVSALLVNGPLFVTIVLGWYLALALHGLLTEEPSDELRSVFA